MKRKPWVGLSMFLASVLVAVSLLMASSLAVATTCEEDIAALWATIEAMDPGSIDPAKTAQIESMMDEATTQCAGGQAAVAEELLQAVKGLLLLP